MKVRTFLWAVLVTILLVITPQQMLAARAIKIFILSGQSNMIGHGKIEGTSRRVKPDRQNPPVGTLRYLVNKNPRKYGPLVDRSGAWVSRDDVWCWSRNTNGVQGKRNYAVDDARGALSVQFGQDADKFGPELAFGHVVGERYKEPVVLIKMAWGGRSLAKNFRPPTAVEKRGGEVGPEYKLMLAYYEEAMRDIKSQFRRQKFELAGFGWHQGFNDRINPKFTAEYEQNMADFIADVREAFDAEDLPFVIATTGMSVRTPVHKKLVAAQMAMADYKKYRQHHGNVAVVDTTPFYRSKEISPANQLHHWNLNAESYYLIGEAMGEAMMKLVGR